ncbi:MAG TPA: LysM peptidoglycan-binding domain-containing protein [Acidimicrobiia bacterium]|nr:LysM peptidoglycan-binding domain-containing protein [Acidimicrobiia bacterium]
MQAHHQSPTLRLLILLTGACAVFLLVSGRVDASTPEAAPMTYQVQTGDTLWELAEAVTASDVDVRVVVAAIKRMNGLESSALTTGQTLLIPAG